jgi:hypothetical protein
MQLHSWADEPVRLLLLCEPACRYCDMGVRLCNEEARA